MTTRKILTLTLLATTLTLGAAVPRELNATSKQQSNSISNQIANTLYRRGIEEDTAQELSQDIINVDEEVFAYMLQTYATSTGIPLDKLYHELGKMALAKKQVDFSSYAFLLKLSQTLKKEHLTSKDLKKLENIATRNRVIHNSFA